MPASVQSRIADGWRPRQKKATSLSCEMPWKSRMPQSRTAPARVRARTDVARLSPTNVPRLILPNISTRIASAGQLLDRLGRVLDVHRRRSVFSAVRGLCGQLEGGDGGRRDHAVCIPPAGPVVRLDQPVELGDIGADLRRQRVLGARPALADVE